MHESLVEAQEGVFSSIVRVFLRTSNVMNMKIVVHGAQLHIIHPLWSLNTPAVARMCGAGCERPQEASRETTAGEKEDRFTPPL